MYLFILFNTDEEEQIVVRDSQVRDVTNEPIRYHKWDFFIGRATVDGTMSLRQGTSPFIENLLGQMKIMHATQVPFYISY
jgi:hypothetical protein